MADSTNVIIETDKGDITLELYPELVPDTVANFLTAVDEGFYAGTIFHRVIQGFMIQGGGLDGDMREKPWEHTPVKNEAASCMPNERGTIAMARTSEPHSATTQFFINTSNNGSLNYKSATSYGFGYCTFGMVTDGMDVVDAIEGVDTTSRFGHDDVPKDVIRIKAVRRA
ncbi:peptidyl-prolyl cis-trans isomerase B (rotamase B) [uncultured delta proteobacterium]|uniref:Peptidyl-prolyl cis-trans isomerase n=1 Tax=uncultured delta proteobacterium TaxID=34034 RepID=A0A212JZS7_9DELT|nr:peptidyl-prolyl cis-trans isomerase B (rotamase B) [uncultured delta proteobacterium]